MAIDIFCYTKLDVSFLDEKISLIKSKYNNVFDSSYLMYKANSILNRQELALLKSKVEQYHKETKLLIAEEFGLGNARSYFMISVNDKTFSKCSTSGVADILRKELGSENIIVLHNGDVLI